MEIRSLKSNGVAIKTKQGHVAYNPEKELKTEPILALYSFPVAVKGCGNPIAEGEHIVVNSAGDYEVQGIPIYGRAAKTEVAGKHLYATSYALTIEGMQVLIVSPCVRAKDIKAAVGSFKNIQVLVAPIVESALSAGDVVSLATELGVSVVCTIGGDDKFNKKIEKELGNVEATNSFTVKKSDLHQDAVRTVVLT